MSSSVKKITKRTVDALQAGDIVWDGDVRGFGVRCQRRDKTYVLKYRFQGRQRWVSIGKHGSPWTPDKARNEAVRLLGLLADNKDPAQVRDETKNDLTVKELCDLYVAEGCSLKKPSTIANDRGRIERHIKPLLGRKHCRHVSKSDVEQMRNDVAAGKTSADIKTKLYGRAIVTGGKGTANKAVSLLGAIFSFAVDRSIRPDNPAHGVKFYPSKRQERFLSPAELGRLGLAMDEAEQDGLNPFAVAAIRLLLLTGARKGEILSLRWGDVDFDRAYLRLPDSKTGQKLIPIGPPALSVLEALPQVSGNSHVLPGSRVGQPLVNISKVWRAIRKAADLEDVRLHDLRHSFASVGAAGGDSLLVIGKVLGHSDTATTARYAHLADDPLQQAASRISEVIADALKGDAPEVKTSN
jgi:integrase